MPLLEDISLSTSANSRQSLQDLAYYCLCFIFGFLFQDCFEKCPCEIADLMQLEDDKICNRLHFQMLEMGFHC